MAGVGASVIAKEALDAEATKEAAAEAEANFQE